MPHHVWSAQHEHEHEHEHLHWHLHWHRLLHRPLLHRLLHQRDSLLERTRPASSADAIAARAASQARARQTKGWP